MNPILQDLSCALIPGKYPDQVSIPELYNRVYKYWKTTWGEIFSRVGSPASLNAENFLRQNIFITLHRGEQIAGLIGTTIYNLSANAVFDHDYLQAFPQDLRSRLYHAGSGTFTTSEYLCVHPEFRKSLTEISLSEVLIGLNFKVFRARNADVILGTSVRPAKVHESCLCFGSSIIGTVQKYGLDCMLLYNDRDHYHEHTDPTVRAVISDFWARRNDLTGLTNEIPIPVRRVA